MAAGIGATVVAGDVTDSAFCDHAVAETLERHGRLDALVNAAGTIVRADALGTTTTTGIASSASTLTEPSS